MAAPRGARPAAPAPTIELEPFLAELEAAGFTREQASEYLATLVPLLWHFVNAGFSGDISQLFVPSEDSSAVDFSNEATREKPSAIGSEETAT